MSRSTPVLAVDELVIDRGVEFRLGPVHLSLNTGECVAVIGGNGSGKSTLLHAIAGDLPAARGRVDLGPGTSMLPRPASAKKPYLVTLPQRPFLPPGVSVGELLRLVGLRLYKGLLGPCPARAESPVQRLLSVLPPLSDIGDKAASTLSGGQQKVLALLLRVARAPTIMMLDEPFSGLHEDTARAVRHALREWLQVHQGAILLVEHELHHVAELAQRIVVLPSAGPPRTLDASKLADADLLAEAWWGAEG